MTVALTGQTISVTLGEMAEEVKTVTGSGKDRIEDRRGHQFNKAGRRMKKVRIVDRRNNRYIEHVSDPETGEVLRDVDHPLKEHTGHGAAKVGKK